MCLEDGGKRKELGHSYRISVALSKYILIDNYCTI